MSKSRTTPYHPAGDGLVERMNRTLVSTLRAYASAHPTSWDSHLQLCLLAYRTAVQKSTGFTPAHLMLSRELRLPPDIAYGLPPDYPSASPATFAQSISTRMRDVYDQARRQDQSAHRIQKDYYDRRAVLSKFSVGQLVWLLDTALKPGESSKLHNPWSGPYRVKATKGTSHELAKPNSPHSFKWVHSNRLKVCHSQSEQPTVVSHPPPAPPPPPQVSSYDWPDDDPAPPQPVQPVVQPVAPQPLAVPRPARPVRNAGLPHRLRNDYQVFRV